MAGEGVGTSLYMMALLKDYHHDPKFGPFEAKKYEGSDRTFLPFIPRTMPGHGSNMLDSQYSSLEGRLGNDSMSPSSTYTKSFLRSPSYDTYSTKADKGCYH